MKNIARLLTVFAVLLFATATQAQNQTNPGCYNADAVSATGRVLIFTNQGSDVMNFSGSYYTTGSPTGVSITIETGNVLAATSAPFTKISALTNTTSAQFAEADGGERYWYFNLGTLSGGTSPTVIVSYCMRKVSVVSNSQLISSNTSATLAAAITDETGSAALVFANTPTLVTPELGAATGTSLALGGGTALATTNRTGTGNLVLATTPTLITPVLGVATGTSAIFTGTSANILTAGANGATNPVFNVNANTASVATGMNIVGAAAGGGLAISVTSSGANENLTFNAKGAGTIGIGSVSTGAVTVTPATTITGALTPTGGVAAAGGFTASCRNFAAGGLVPAVSTDFTDATPVITETYITEVFVPANCSATGIAVFNGSNVTGNMNVGLANSTGAVVAESADTAGSGTDAYQRIAFTGAYAVKGPATYYILVQYSSATARYNAPPLGNHGCSVKTGETFGTFTTVTPPTNCAANVGNIAALY